jgi:hypothetical protein
MGGIWSYCLLGMAGEGRQHGMDPFEVAARREDLDDPPAAGLELSSEVHLPKRRRWPHILRRYGALALAVVVAAASAFVLGRSLTPAPESRVVQELSGRKPQRNSVANTDLAPDWTHTRGLDRERRRSRDMKRKAGTRSRRSIVRVGGGGTRAPRPTQPSYVATAPSGTSAPQKDRRSGGKSDKNNGGKGHAAPEEPQLPEPAVPLYHLVRTFKKKKPNHFFTGDAAMKDEKVEGGWQFLATEGFMFDRAYEGTVAVPADNGVPGYIYAEKEPGALPLYMLRGYNGYGDIFTSDAAYRDRMIDEGWNDFGIIGYIAQT